MEIDVPHLKTSKAYLYLNKTRGISEFKSDHAFYRALQSRRTLLHKSVGLSSNHCYQGTNQTEKYVTERSNISTVMDEGVKMFYKLVTEFFLQY